MHQVVFVQGGGRGAHAVDARLAASLAAQLGADYEVRFPAMPREEDPRYEAWSAVIAAELAAIGDAILVAHSVGAAVVVRFLAENAPVRGLAGVFLVAAPFIGEGGWSVEGFTLPRDIGARLPNVPIHLYHGRKDEIVPFAHLDLYAAALPRAHVHRFDGRNHQLDDDLSAVARDIERLEKDASPGRGASR